MPDEEPDAPPPPPSAPAWTDEEVDWSDLRGYANDARFLRKDPDINNLDTVEGQARVLKNIIGDDEEKTENKLAAIKQLRELRGTDRIKTEDIKKLSNDELTTILKNDVAPILKCFVKALVKPNAN